MGAGMWYELGQRLVELTDAPLKRTLFSLAIAIVAALISVLVRTASDRSGHQGLDAVAVGVFVFIVSYAEVRAVNARRKRLLREVSKIAELNHQVRNALQSIRYAAHLGTEAKYVEVIEDSVKRIAGTDVRVHRGHSKEVRRTGPGTSQELRPVLMRSRYL
jgi:hypothetical protein